MTPYDRQQLREELYREEQLLNLTLTLIPWIYLLTMFLINTGLEHYGEQIHGDINLFPGHIRTRHYSMYHDLTYDLGPIGLLFIPDVGFYAFLAYGLLMPVPRRNRSFRENEEWNIIEDWRISGDKIAALAGSGVCAVLLFLYSSPGFCGNHISRTYNLILMGASLILALVCCALIRWVLGRKIHQEVYLSYRQQTFVRVLSIISFFVIIFSPIAAYIFRT